MRKHECLHESGHYHETNPASGEGGIRTRGDCSGVVTTSKPKISKKIAEKWFRCMLKMVYPSPLFHNIAKVVIVITMVADF